MLCSFGEGICTSPFIPHFPYNFRLSFKNNFLLLSCQEVISSACVNLCWHMLIQPCWELSAFKLQWQQIHKLQNLLRVTSVLRCISTALAKPDPAMPAQDGALQQGPASGEDTAWASPLLKYQQVYFKRVKICCSSELHSAARSDVSHGERSGAVLEVWEVI